MEIEIQSRTKNPLLNREEVVFKINHEGESTPQRTSVIAKLAAILNADKNQTILKEIRGHFGVQYSIGYANLYDNAESAKILEPKYILKRNGLLESEGGDE